ncbi:MAG: HEPN domain-containing protein [Deltaproteobacteria bacterium]|nr:HEPN domain-containing protein [Deltaproteobacteria bacterium]
MKPHERWFYFADQDLAFARAGFRDGFYAHVCSLSQQAVEKAMKAYLVWKQRNPPKTHGLLALHRLLDVSWMEAHLPALKRLSEFYLPTRYPDAIAGTLPDGLPDRGDAKQALAWADAVVQLVRGKMRGARGVG